MNTSAKVVSLFGRTLTQRIAAFIAGGTLLSLVGFAAQSRYRLVFQYDSSVDFCLAYVDRGKQQIARGDYFAFAFLALPEDPRYGRAFIKRLACVEGDHLRNVGRDFYCNGQHIGRANEVSREGKPLPVFEYTGAIPPGRLFAVGDVQASYDSMIWGFVRQEWVVGTVRKIM